MVLTRHSGLVIKCFWFVCVVWVCLVEVVFFRGKFVWWFFFSFAGITLAEQLDLEMKSVVFCIASTGPCSFSCNGVGVGQISSLSNR